MGRSRVRAVDWAGVRVAIEVPAHFDWSFASEANASLSCAPIAADVQVGVRVGPTDAPKGESIEYGFEGGSFEIGREGSGWWIAVHGQRRFERVARFDENFSWGEVVVHPDLARTGVFPLSAPIDDLIVLHRVARTGGLVLQGMGMVGAGSGLAFVGHAPSIARIASQQSVREPRGRLLGNRIVLRPCEGGVTLHGTPWQRGAPFMPPPFGRLDAVHVVTQSNRARADRLTRTQAAEELLQYAYAPIHDPEMAERWMTAAHELANRIPVLYVAHPKRSTAASFLWGERHASMGFAQPS